MQMPRAGGDMAIFLKFQPQGWDGMLAQQLESGMGSHFSSEDSEWGSTGGSGSVGGVPFDAETAKS